MHFEVGWTDDVRAAVARACGEVYAGSTIQECVDLMVDRVEGDRTLTIDIVVDGAGLRERGRRALRRSAREGCRRVRWA